MFVKILCLKRNWIAALWWRWRDGGRRDLIDSALQDGEADLCRFLSRFQSPEVKWSLWVNSSCWQVSASLFECFWWDKEAESVRRVCQEKNDLWWKTANDTAEHLQTHEINNRPACIQWSSAWRTIRTSKLYQTNPVKPWSSSILTFFFLFFLSLHLSLCGTSRAQNVFKPLATCDLLGKPGRRFPN